MSTFLEQYEPLDIIGNGSFGIIRKVRRKSDGTILARKELNFERMSERDRKQIVAEVNILKDLHHDHIVRYHDRYVDREAGILYILMEYCGGGDLSSIIKQAQKHNRTIPEDTIWNYFMQILLALHHCHHPAGQGRPSTGGEGDANERRAQILHRDLKPDNVFLDENNTVKLGDFGLSKALAQASFANTYVGTPYYMSPELMQEKAYDSKSDIWSLGCLIYELCAMKPPFHEAKTHAELSVFIRNGRIPPLPRGYSQSLASVIKAMLNLNPAMRPSAAQLLSHERLELVFKVSESVKLMQNVKAHKASVVAREREITAREGALAEKEAKLASVLAEKEQENASLKNVLAEYQRQAAAAVHEAVVKREEELRLAVKIREEEVVAAMTKREKEILEAVERREQQQFEAWRVREEQIRKELEERVTWMDEREEELKEEAKRLEEMKEDLETRSKAVEAGRKEKTPMEEVKNLLAPLSRLTDDSPPSPFLSSKRAPGVSTILATPRPATRFPAECLASAMKGVVLTATGEPLATPAPIEVSKLFDKSPKVGLNFTKLFDEKNGKGGDSVDEETKRRPKSPSKVARKNSAEDGVDLASTITPSSSSSSNICGSSQPALPTRIRRPSIRKAASASAGTRSTSSRCASRAAQQEQQESTSTSNSTSNSTSSSSSTTTATSDVNAPPLKKANTLPLPSSAPTPAPEYDFSDEENLPSPFLKRIDRERPVPFVPARSKRPSNGQPLRVVAAHNSVANALNGIANGGGTGTIKKSSKMDVGMPRSSLTLARKATEEAKKVLAKS